MAEIDPNIRVYIAALRAGKDWRDAFKEYCWAKLAVPIDGQLLRDLGDPMLCPRDEHRSMASAMGSDAFDDGGSDQEIAAAFTKGLAIDRERDVYWRPMEKSERPTHGQLLRAMDSESLMTAGRLLGYAQVARAYTSR